MAKTAMDEVAASGAFVRTEASFRSWVKADGSTQYTPEAGRYHLYVSYACPWASRCLAVRALKGLESAIGLSVVDAVMAKTKDDPADQHHGWWFKEDGAPPNTADAIHGCKTVRELYEKHSKDVAKFTVPVLYDTKTMTIVSNESAEIIRMFNAEFNAIAQNPDLDLYPAKWQAQIDAVNEWVYPSINNGVYRAGFAQSQAAYDEAVADVFNGLERAEGILAQQRYIACPGAVTEADIRLFVTLVRFDEVYHGHFKCNKRRIADYPNLEHYVREIYQLVPHTVNMDHIRRHYHMSHPTINKFAIVPIGPKVDYSLPHDRAEKKFAWTEA